MSSLHPKQHSRADNDWGPAHHLKRAVDNWIIRGTSGFITIVIKVVMFRRVRGEETGGLILCCESGAVPWIYTCIIICDLHKGPVRVSVSALFYRWVDWDSKNLRIILPGVHLAKQSPLTPIPELFLWHGTVPYKSQGFCLVTTIKSKRRVQGSHLDEMLSFVKMFWILLESQNHRVWRHATGHVVHNLMFYGEAEV